MAQGKAAAELDVFVSQQEGEWERAAQMLWLLHHVRLTMRGVFGGKVEAHEIKDVDDFNLWLNVPGAEMPDAEREKQGNEIIAERKRIAREAREAANGS
jgi:hypothetical protein